MKIPFVDLKAQYLFLKPQIDEAIQNVIHEELCEGEFSKYVDGKKRNVDELGTMLLDITKAKKILNWSPQTTLIEGVRKEYYWAKNNPHRWEKILSTKW